MYNPFITHKDFFASAAFKAVIICLLGIIVALTVFKAGMVVGYRKAAFAYRWGDVYHRNFGGPERGFGQFANEVRDDRAFVEGHGAFGQIVAVDLPLITVGGIGDQEKIVRVDDRTMVRRFERDIRPVDLTPEDFVVVIGSPRDDGQIDAKFIRVLPRPGAEPVRLPLKRHFWSR